MIVQFCVTVFPHSLFHHENAYVYCAVDVDGTAYIRWNDPHVSSGCSGVPHPHGLFNEGLFAF